VSQANRPSALIKKTIKGGGGARMTARNTHNSYMASSSDMMGGRHSETFSPGMAESKDVQPFFLDSSRKKHREP